MRLVCVLGLGLLLCARISGQIRPTAAAHRVQTCLTKAIGDAHESRTKHCVAQPGGG